LPVVVVVFLLGIGHASPLQQHSAPFFVLQQACAFLPFFFFLQQDMSLSPALQQSFEPQQASPLCMPHCGAGRVRAAVETAMAAVQARLIKSILTFRIIVFSRFKELLFAIREECLDDSERLVIVRKADL
jgi:hypothetical protein